MRRRIHLSRGRVRRYVERAVRALPVQFREAAENVVVVVENRPKRADEGWRHDDETPVGEGPLLGVYRGVPLTERVGYDLLAPDVIAVFRTPLLKVARTRREAEREVQLTVLHEIGHFLGLSEEQVEHL